MHRVALQLAGIAAIWASPALAQAPVRVRLEPAELTIPVGSTFTLEVVADLTQADVGWGLDLHMDPVGVISLAAPPAIPSPPWRALNAPDGDSLAALALPEDPVNGSVQGQGILLATLTFLAETLGQVQLRPTYTPNDLTEGFPLDPSGFATPEFEPAEILVVPEPASLSALTLAGLLTMEIGRRMRRRRVTC